MAARKAHRVVRKAPKRTVHRGAQSKRSTIKKSTAPPKKSKSFSLLPKAHAAGAPLGLAGTIGRQVVKKLKPLKGVKRLGPSRNKTIKSVTYKNQIEAGLMKKTGGGVPLYKGYDKIPPVHATTQSGVIDTRLLDLTGIKRTNALAATRANQAMITAGPGGVKHTVKKKSFVKVIPGGPVLDFMGPNKTRYRKRQLKTVTTPETLVQGQDPITPKSGLEKFMVAPVAVSTIPLWDQIGDVFNPVQEAYAMPGVTPLVAKAAQLLGKNVKLSWTQFRNQEGIANTAANKAEFQKIKDAFVKGKNKISMSGGGDKGPGGSSKMDRKKYWKGYAKSGLMIAGSAATLGIVTNPEANQWYTDAIGGQPFGPAVPGETSPQTEQEAPPVTETPATGGDQTTVPPPVIPYGTEGSEQTMQEAQAAYVAGLTPSASAAGPQPTWRYGLPGEKGLPNPNYTQVTYKKYDPKHADADEAGFIDASQWVKLGMGGSAAGFSATMTRQATKKQVNEMQKNTLDNINKATKESNRSDKLLARAEAAEREYAKPGVAALLGPLPEQYRVVLAADAQRENKYAEYITWQQGGPYTQGDPYPEGHAKAGEYPITITPSGKDNPNFKKSKDETE